MSPDPEFRAFCRTNRTFWQMNLPANPAPGPDGPVVLVEALCQDVRVVLRNLIVANAIRRIEPARLMLVGGIDADWRNVVWQNYDWDMVTELAESFGADPILDVHALVDERLAAESKQGEVAVSQECLDQIVSATTARLGRVPRATEANAELRSRIHDRSREFATVYEDIFNSHDVRAVVTSHVDYNVFGLLVETATRHQVPVVFPQSTGGLKAYARFPEAHRPGRTFREDLTGQIADFFNEELWPRREELARASDRVLHRVKVGFGRPAWWRGGSDSRVEITTPDQRAAVRRVGARQVGVDPDRPIVVVFNHAISDALGTNRESFADLAEWFEATAVFAADHPEVSWIFLDHPQAELYDGSGFARRIADRHADDQHMVFCSSLDIGKTTLAALVDLVVTVRGSASNEYPAYGIPALMAGWSEWSGCGFSTVAVDAVDYFDRLASLLAALLAGEELMSAEQVARARLWAWFYRAASDVSTVFTEHWSLDPDSGLFSVLERNLRQFEPDGDPLFRAVDRMWLERRPFLTREDWPSQQASHRSDP